MRFVGGPLVSIFGIDDMEIVLYYGALVAVVLIATLFVFVTLAKVGE
jgi:hypothetical protein